MWPNPTAYDGFKKFEYKFREFIIKILNQNRLSKAIRFLLSEPLKCIFHPMNIKPSK
jgi:hypothetical protein